MHGVYRCCDETIDMQGIRAHRTKEAGVGLGKDMVTNVTLEGAVSRKINKV